MSFFSKLVKPNRKGQKNFERARAAETRTDYEKARSYFDIAAQAYDEYFADIQAKGKDARPSELVMAGMCYTRLGRNEDALRVLDLCISLKEIPDAYLHAGYAAAKLGDVDRTIKYWSGYPAWIEQKFMQAEIKDQLRQLRGPSPDLGAACEAIVRTGHKQDKHNKSALLLLKKGQTVYPPDRGY